MRAMSEVWLKDRRGAVMMLMLGLNETIDQFSMANSVCWYDYVLRRVDGHVLTMALDIEVEAEMKKWGLERT